MTTLAHPTPARPTISVPIPFTGAYASLAALCAVLSWEWTVSTLDKVVNRVFVDNFASYVMGTVRPGSPALYRDFLTRGVVPHARFFALLSIGTEAVLAVSFALASVALVLRLRALVRPVLMGVLVASAGSAVFAVNLAILNGDPLPWSVTGAPFQAGIPVEYLLTLVSMAGVVGAGILLRRTHYLRRQRPASA